MMRPQYLQRYRSSADDLYHSVVSASRDLGGASTRWLNIHSLCSSYLPAFGKTAITQSVHYFAALPYYLNDPNKLDSQKRFNKCLEHTGVDVQLSKTQEEKETDGALAAKLFDLLITNSAETVALVTDDTDLVPAAKTVNSLYPQGIIRFLSPYKRSNHELKHLVPDYIDIERERYVAHQFSNSYRMPRNKASSTPPSW
jgi:uncharacterized LabA/DUF88 family protein